MEQTSKKETEYEAIAISVSFNIYKTSTSATAEVIDNNETTDLSGEGGNLSLTSFDLEIANSVLTIEESKQWEIILSSMLNDQLKSSIQLKVIHCMKFVVYALL